MKLQRPPIEVFNLAFLDIISCAFGAVVMLILLARNGDAGSYNDISQISSLIQSLSQAEQSVSTLASALSDKEDQLKQMQANSASNADQNDALEADVARAKNNVQQLTDAASGLVTTTQDKKRAAIKVGKATKRDEAVGGIPIDSEYVVFIIDTSGSMKRIWPKILNTMSELLNNHPQVKGFQVMSDNGHYLLRASKGRWRKDTPRQRQAVLNAMRHWNSASSSSPIEGIEESLKTYAQKTGSLALYILGDDYTGASYDAALARINRLNTNRKTRKRVARIHGIGFITSGYANVKFATLMREVSRQNNGTFLTVN